MTQDTDWRYAMTRYVKGMPHTRATGLEVIKASKGDVTMRLPWQPWFAGDLSRGLVHGGVITMVLDTLCTGTVLCGLGRPEICPTLDLRIDHYRPARVGHAMVANAIIVNVTGSIATVEGTLWQVNAPEKTIARAVGSFARLPPEMTPHNFERLLCGRPTHSPNTESHV
ncbi:PaaI family thioesterase [Larsenimonas salina]|uniref:PaaI family thioesterase n=1 Tax=Larsenimonas salina TaxID=1295565 RepID=UPI002072B708|nr:PaaI family thioesterase [Larsenimonas salina]MCM5703568.1 PaaI family thioesterase [Larsenimonas salina]